MLRASAWIVGSLLALVTAGIVYLILNPPFDVPETGYLSRAATREVQLGPGSSLVAYRVQASFDESIYEDPTGDFEPARVTATLQSDAPADAGLALRVYPEVGGQMTDLTRDPDQPRADWRVPCDPPSADGGCSPAYVVVISADALAAATEATLDLFAEQRFPAHVETPFLVSIDIDIEEVALPEEAVLGLAAADASLTLSPDAPVAHHDLATEADPDAPGLGGATLEVSVTREGEALPTGFDAPAPVRLALLDETGAVVVELGPRPGTRSTVALPPLDGNHEVVAWWQDRADQVYDVDWSIEVAAIAAGEPVVTVGRAAFEEPIHDASSEGESQVTIDRDSALEMGIPVDIGESGAPDGLTPALGVLHLTLELIGDETDAPALLILAPDRFASSRGSVPIVLRPGEPTDVALEAFPGCRSSTCESWWGTLGVTDPSDVDRSNSRTIRWSSTLELWPLGAAAGGRP